MTYWSIPLTGIRGRRPRNSEWKNAFKHDTRIIVEGDCPSIINLPHFPGMSLSHYEYNGEDLSSKFQGNYDFNHLLPHLPTTYCEIIIDDSEWKRPFMPDYPGHNEDEKLQTIMMASSTLVATLRLIGFNQFITPCILKNGTLSTAVNSDEKSIEFIPTNPFLFPTPLLELEKSKARLSKSDFEWVCKSHIILYQMCFIEDLTPAMSAMKYYYQDMPTRARMTIIWAAIEDLLKPKGNRIRFGIRARGAMLLGRNDKEVETLFKQIGNLYGKRSAATHGRRFTYMQGLKPDISDNRLRTDIRALMTSYQLLCELLIKIIDRGSLFNELELQELEESYSEKFSSE